MPLAWACSRPFLCLVQLSLFTGPLRIYLSREIGHRPRRPPRTGKQAERGARQAHARGVLEAAKYGTAAPGRAALHTRTQDSFFA